MTWAMDSILELMRMRPALSNTERIPRAALPRELPAITLDLSQDDVNGTILLKAGLDGGKGHSIEVAQTRPKIFIGSFQNQIERDQNVSVVRTKLRPKTPRSARQPIYSTVRSQSLRKTRRRRSA